MDADGSRAGGLDESQYAAAEIRKYEAIYGRNFVSPGGEATARECVAMLGLRPGERVWDIGCGLGGSAFLMAREHGVRVTGMDVSRNMIAVARERCREAGLDGTVTLVEGDCLAWCEPGAFDAAYSRDAFLHIADKGRLFDVVRRALKPGGRVLITDYCCGEAPWSEEFSGYVLERGYSLHTVAEYREMLEEAGFVQVSAEDRTERFVAIHRAELVALRGSRLPAGEASGLERGWRAKIARAGRGEQRWGLFRAVRG